MNPAAIDLRLLRSFINTARLGSVTKAANAMHLTQPALSQHLRELGTLTGVPLFDRVGRGLSLTAAGADLFREVEPLLLQLDFVLTSVKDRSREVRGSIRIGAIETYARALVIPAVAQLLEQHPELTVAIEELPAPEIDRGLAQGELDIGVAFSHLSSADIEQRTLFEEGLMLVYLAGKRRVKLPSVTLQQVAQYPLALLNRSFAMRRQIDAAFARADVTLDVRGQFKNPCEGLLTF
jgi:LysR family cyn operon transcriptional activator